MAFDSSLSNPLLFLFLHKAKKKECKFNLGGLKKQNRLWHCHANNKTGWHVDSFKLVGVHIILLMYILNVMHGPFLPSFWVFNEWWHETSKTWLAQKILNFLESFVLFFLFLHAKTIKRLSFSNPVLQKQKKGLPNMEKVRGKWHIWHEAVISSSNKDLARVDFKLLWSIILLVLLEFLDHDLN